MRTKLQSVKRFAVVAVVALKELEIERTAVAAVVDTAVAADQKLAAID